MSFVSTAILLLFVVTVTINHLLDRGLGNYEESTRKNAEKPKDTNNTERSKNDSQTTESPTVRPRANQSLPTSDEMPTVTTATSAAPPTEED